jgi:DNA-binding Lrp family transcriptional regulator
MPVRNLKFRRGFSSKTLAKRLKELDEYGILERQAYNESPRQSTALEIESRQSKKDKTYRYHPPHIQSLVQYYASLHLAA